MTSCLERAHAPPHSTWSTQLEDPRLNKLPEQVSQLNVFLHHARHNIHDKQLQIKALEERMKFAESEVQRLSAQAKAASTKGGRNVRFQDEIAERKREIAATRSAIAALQQDMRYDEEGVQILADVGARMDEHKGYGIEEARVAVQELQHMRQMMVHVSEEKARLEQSLRKAVTQQASLPTYEEAEDDAAAAPGPATQRLSKKELEEIIASAHAKDDADLRVRDSLM